MEPTSQHQQNKHQMPATLHNLKTAFYNTCELQVSNFEIEPESKEYAACRFALNGRKIVSRNAKITPKKSGQFVTFWKRKEDGPIEPLHENDSFDYFIVEVTNEQDLGLFILPKSILLKKGIISTDKKEGKRAFRVYSPWDIVSSQQAERTQKWQLDFFYATNSPNDLKKITAIFKTD